MRMSGTACQVVILMKKKRLNQSWLHAHLNDAYVKRARQEGYRTRAVYKLQEIDEQDKLIRPGQCIIDLGAAPGGWSQYIQRKLIPQAHSVPRGRIIALDMLPMAPIPGVQFIQGDFREEAIFRQLEAAVGAAGVDLMLSDMAPNLSGIAAADAARMAHLCEISLDFAKLFLKPQGALLVKCFHGSGYSQLVALFKKHFQKVAARKPQASRDKSAEVFILGKFLK